MTHTIIIETQNESEFAQIKGLAEKLGLRYKEDHAELRSQDEALQVLERVCWEGNETADELNTMIQEARHFGSRDVEL